MLIDIKSDVANFITNLSTECLTQIIIHGIHTYTNEFHCDTALTHAQYDYEFKVQALAKLLELAKLNN